MFYIVQIEKICLISPRIAKIKRLTSIYGTDYIGLQDRSIKKSVKLIQTYTPKSRQTYKRFPFDRSTVVIP